MHGAQRTRAPEHCPPARLRPQARCLGSPIACRVKHGGPSWKELWLTGVVWHLDVMALVDRGCLVVWLWLSGTWMPWRGLRGGGLANGRRIQYLSHLYWVFLGLSINEFSGACCWTCSSGDPSCATTGVWV
jgi:hypothetical protein